MTFLIAYLGGAIAMAVMCLVGYQMGAEMDNSSGLPTPTILILLIFLWPMLVALPYMVKK